MKKLSLRFKRIVSLAVALAIVLTGVVVVGVITANAENVYADENIDFDFKMITNGSYYEGVNSEGTYKKGEGDGKYELRSNAHVAWWGEDDIAFAYKQYDIGSSGKDNLTVETEVISHIPDTPGISVIHENASAGLMMRDGLDADSAMIFVHVRRDWILTVYRQADGQEARVGKYVATPSYPVKLRIVREGNVFTTYCKADSNLQWIKIDSVSLLFDGPTYAGIANHSCEVGTFVKSSFQGFTANGKGTWTGSGEGGGDGGGGDDGGAVIPGDTLEQLPGEPPREEPFDPEKEPNVLLYETFSDGSRVKGPEAVNNPVWKNPSGELVELEDGNRVWYKNYADTFDFIGDDAWSDYSLSANLKYGDLANPQLDGKVLFYVRHKEYVTHGAADYAVVIENYTYTVDGKIQYDETGMNPIRKLRAYVVKRERSKLETIGTTALTEYYPIEGDWFKDDTFHNITVDAFDNTITLRIDGVKVLEYADETTVINSFGNIGFETRNTSVYLDNIKVTALEDALGGAYDNHICGNWDQPIPAYIAEMGIPDAAFADKNQAVWDSFFDKKNKED